MKCFVMIRQATPIARYLAGCGNIEQITKPTEQSDSASEGITCTYVHFLASTRFYISFIYLHSTFYVVFFSGKDYSSKTTSLPAVTNLRFTIFLRKWSLTKTPTYHHQPLTLIYILNVGLSAMMRGSDFPCVLSI